MPAERQDMEIARENRRRRLIIAVLALAMTAGGGLAIYWFILRPPTNPNAFTSDEFGFSITAPADWRKMPDQDGSAVLFCKQLDASVDDCAFVSVTANRIGKGLDVRQYMARAMFLLREYLEDSLTGVKPSSGTKLAKDDKAGLLRQSYSIDRAGRTYRYLALFAVRDRFGYHVQCWAPVEKFNGCRDIFDAICQTFQTNEVKKGASGSKVFVVEASSKYRAFTSKEFGICVPRAWETVEEPPALLRFMEPLTSGADTWRERVDVFTAPLPAGVRLNTYAAATLKDLSDRLSEFKVISSVKADLDGMEARRSVYRYKVDGRPLKSLIYVIAADSKAYVLDCTTTPETYALYQPVFEGVVDSFEVFSFRPDRKQ
jgi:hypothetical protein